MHVAVQGDGRPMAPEHYTNHSHNRRNKRFQACIACRGTKTKCLPSEQPGICQSCLKSSRPCIPPGPAKPRLKSAQKFSELEKKIEILTNALANKDSGISTSLEVPTNRQNSENPQNSATSSTASSPSDRDDDPMVPDVEFYAALSPDLTNPAIPARLDVVEDGLIGQKTATDLFIHWNNNMRRFVPLALFPLDMGAEEVRKVRPVLFLSIITIASSSIYPSLSTQLVVRLTQELSQRIFVHNIQDIDIILATQLFSQYYFQPGGSTNFAPSQYIYAAIAMSSDLGLHAQAKNLLTEATPSAFEAAHVCLSEWYAASITTTLLHRDPLVRFTPNLEKYAQILQQNNQDQWLFSLVKLQQIIEGASLLLDASEHKSEDAFDQPSTQYKISMLQQQLNTWEHNLPRGVDDRIKQHGVHTAYLYIHAIAVRCYIRKVSPDFKRGGKRSAVGSDEGLMGLTPSHFDCLTRCLAAAKASFDIYISFEAPLARCLPNNYLFWNIHSAILLIKLGHFGEILERSTGGQEARAGQPPYQPVVVQYLDAISAKLDSVSEDGYFPQAKPYGTVIRKLKSYYLQKQAVCIDSKGDAISMAHEGAPPILDPGASANLHARGVYTPEDVSMRSPSDMATSRYIRSSHRQQPQSSSDGRSHGEWTPSPAFSQGAPRTPILPSQYEHHLGSPAFHMHAAYDPYTYANTDWASLNPVAMQQLDSYMWSDEDTAWMQSLL